MRAPKVYNLIKPEPSLSGEMAGVQAGFLDLTDRIRQRLAHLAGDRNAKGKTQPNPSVLVSCCEIKSRYAVTDEADLSSQLSLPLSCVGRK